MRAFALFTALLVSSPALTGVHAQPKKALRAPVHPDTLPTLMRAWSLPASLSPFVTNTYVPRMVRSGMLLYIYDHHGRRLVAVKAATGKVAWHKPVPSRTKTAFAFTPLVYKKRVLVANDQNLYSFNALTGELRWRMPTKGIPINGLARSKHRVYLTWIRTAGKMAQPGVTLWAVDSRRARVEWTKTFAGDRFAHVTGDSNGAYYVGHSGAIFGLTPDRGDYMWKLRIKGQVTDQPILKSGKLYVTSLRRKAGWKGTGVYVIDVKTGKVLWQTKLAGTKVTKFLVNKQLVTVEEDGRLTHFDDEGKKVFSLDLNFVDVPRSMFGTAVGTRAFIFSSHQDGNGFLRLVDIARQKMIVTANALDKDIRGLIPAAKILYLDGADGDIYAYRLKSKRPKQANVLPDVFAREMLLRVGGAKAPIRGLAPKLAGLGAKALSAIEPSLQSSNPFVVQVAAQAIGLIGSRRSVGALVKAVRSMSASAPVAGKLDALLGVIDALALLRDGRAVGALQRVMKDQEQGHMRQRAAYVALGAISTPVSLAPIWAVRAAKSTTSTKWDPQAFTPSFAYKVEQDVRATQATQPLEVRKKTSLTVQTKNGKIFSAVLSPYLGGYNDIWVGYSDLSGAIANPIFTQLTKPEFAPNKRIQIHKLKLTKKGYVRLVIRIKRGKRWLAAKPVFLKPKALLADRDGDKLPDVVEQRLHLCVTNADSDGDGLKDAVDINPLASSKQKPTLEQKLFREAFFAYFAFLKRRGIVVVDPGKGPSFELYGRSDPVLSLRRPTIERLRKKVGLHAIDYVSFGGPYPEGSGSGDAETKVLWNKKKTVATLGMDILRSGENAVAYNVTLKKAGKNWVVSRFYRVWTTNE
jgi:outer membrane protein assembly factor BamB